MCVGVDTDLISDYDEIGCDADTQTWLFVIVCQMMPGH